MITHADVIEALTYVAETGDFYWRKGLKAGRLVGYPSAGRRYWKIQFRGVGYRAHRLAWFYVHGRWPSDLIDHIDGNGQNNALSNLREASHGQNQQNSRPKRDHLKGISLRKSGRWSACIRTSDGKIWLGTYDTEEEAHAVYMAAAHKYFGEFARAA